MVFVLFEMNANVVAYPINIRNKNCKKSSVNIRLWLWLCLAWTRKTTTQMRGTSRPYSVLLHIFSGMKLEYSDLRAGHKFMNITEEGKDRIWIKRYCGDVRNGYLWFRNGSGRLFSKVSSQKWSGESLPVEESEKAIWCELGEVKEDGGHSGNRKGFKLSGREAEILNEIIRILKDGSQVENFLDQLGHSISAKIAVMVMESEKDVKMVFRFFLWATQKTSLIRDQDLHILMIQILKESKEFEVAWDVLREMRKGKMSTAAPFNVLIAAYGKVGMVEKAIESFTLMEEEYSCRPNIFTWNIMLDILVNDQMTEIARALYQRMLTTDCLPNAVTLNILIRGLCNAGKTQEALDFYDEMNARGITANIKTYTIVIKSLCQAGKINMATQLLASMEANNCSPDIVIYNVIINGLCKNGQVDQAFKLLNVLKEEKVSPTGYTYSSLIHGLFKASRFDEACKYCRDFFELQITPDLVSYTVMIDAFCEVGRIDDAFHLFNVMIRTGCLPDTFCYNTLIKGLCKVGLLDEARSVKLEMLQKGCLLDVVTYNTLIFGLCEEGLVEEAHQMLDEMTRNGYFPNVFTYNILIDALFKVGEVTKACILFYQMEMGNSPSLFLNIAQGSKRFGDSADLQALAEGHCSTGLILDAYKLHRRLMESGAVPDVITYNTMINGLCKTCKLDAALKFFKAMHVRGYIPNVITYNTLIDGLCRVNREKDAFTLFQQMAAKGCGPNSVTFKTLMTSLCQEGQEDRISQAFNLWVSYISQRYSLNNQDSSRIQILFNQGNFKEAFRTVVQIDATAIQNSADSGAYCILIIGLCRGGRLDDALKLFASIHESNFDITAPTYIFLITGLCNEGKETKALELFTNSLKRGIFFNLNPDVCDRLFRGM